MLKIKFKTFFKDTFHIEIEPKETIKRLKEKIEQEKGFTFDSQRLLFNLRLLNDKQTVADLKIDQDKQHIVLIIWVPTPFEETCKNQEGIIMEELPPPETIVVHEMVVIELMEMGFERSKVVTALQNAYNNRDQAIEYLLGATPVIPQSTERIKVTPASDEDQDLNPFDFLRVYPIVSNIRRRIQEDPDCMTDVVQETAKLCPDILKIIEDNQAKFIDFLCEPMELDDQAEIVTVRTVKATDANEDLSKTVNPDEKTFIDKLKSMGFSEEMVLQAYKSCDKNEEMAINLLIQQQDEKNN